MSDVTNLNCIHANKVRSINTTWEDYCELKETPKFTCEKCVHSKRTNEVIAEAEKRGEERIKDKIKEELKQCSMEIDNQIERRTTVNVELWQKRALKNIQEIIDKNCPLVKEKK